MKQFRAMDSLPEDSASFWAVYNSETAKTKARLDSSSLAGDELDAIRSHLVEMQKYATESTSILPPYDIRRTQELLDSLGKDLRDSEARLKPKKKFTFSSKSKDKALGASASAGGDGPGPVPTKTESTKTLAVEAAPAASKDAEGGYTLRDLSKDVVFLTEKELGKNKDSILPPLLLTNCTDVVVSARCVLGAARLENCTDCQVFLGPCSTSVYLESCTRCTVFIASHQLRIHKCLGCYLYVRVNSHPIIEDCSQMGFAPYSLMHLELERDMIEAGLRDARCWDNVVDFRWHRTTPSPNWFMIPVADRLSALPHNLAPTGWKLVESPVLAPQSVFSAGSTSAVPVALGEQEEEI